MPNPEPETFTDTDLTNIVRGFDAPAKEDLLEKLLSQAKERDQEINERAEENSVDALYRRKDEQRERNRERDRGRDR